MSINIYIESGKLIGHLHCGSELSSPINEEIMIDASQSRDTDYPVTTTTVGSGLEDWLEIGINIRWECVLIHPIYDSNGCNDMNNIKLDSSTSGGSVLYITGYHADHQYEITAIISQSSSPSSTTTTARVVRISTIFKVLSSSTAPVNYFPLSSSSYDNYDYTKKLNLNALGEIRALSQLLQQHTDGILVKYQWSMYPTTANIGGSGGLNTPLLQSLLFTTPEINSFYIYLSILPHSLHQSTSYKFSLKASLNSSMSK